MPSSKTPTPVGLLHSDTRLEALEARADGFDGSIQGLQAQDQVHSDTLSVHAGLLSEHSGAIISLEATDVEHQAQLDSQASGIASLGTAVGIAQQTADGAQAAATAAQGTADSAVASADAAQASADAAQASADAAQASADGVAAELAGFDPALKDLSAAQITQLSNIDDTEISVQQWEYLGTLDQDLSRSSEVLFQSVEAERLILPDENSADPGPVVGAIRYNSAGFLEFYHEVGDVSFAWVAVGSYAP